MERPACCALAFWIMSSRSAFRKLISSDMDPVASTMNAMSALRVTDVCAAVRKFIAASSPLVEVLTSGVS